MNETYIRDLTTFGAANLEAVTASGKIWADGVTDLTNQVANTAKSSLEETVSAFRALTTAKSVQEAMDLQGTYGKAAFANAMAVSKSLTEASLKLAEQAMGPLTARLAVAVDSLAKAA
jgi:phasin family protein